MIENSSCSTHVAENYLLALCESDRKTELLQLLEIVDITKLSSPDYIANIFKSFGRLLLESFAEKFLVTFKTCGMHIKYQLYQFLSQGFSQKNLNFATECLVIFFNKWMFSKKIIAEYVLLFLHNRGNLVRLSLQVQIVKQKTSQNSSSVMLLAFQI